MMGNLGAFGCSGLGRSNIQLAVHRDRIAIDDLSRESFGDCDGERRLTARGGAEDDQQERFATSGLLRSWAQRQLQWMLCQ
jgi:hypothetical protein